MESVQPAGPNRYGSEESSFRDVLLVPLARTGGELPPPPRTVGTGGAAGNSGDLISDKGRRRRRRRGDRRAWEWSRRWRPSRSRRSGSSFTTGTTGSRSCTRCAGGVAAAAEELISGGTAWPARRSGGRSRRSGTTRRSYSCTRSPPAAGLECSPPPGAFWPPSPGTGPGGGWWGWRGATHTSSPASSRTAPSTVTTSAQSRWVRSFPWGRSASRRAWRSASSGGAGLCAGPRRTSYSASPICRSRARVV